VLFFLTKMLCQFKAGIFFQSIGENETIAQAVIESWAHNAYPSTLASSCTFTARIRFTSTLTDCRSWIVTPAPFGLPCFAAVAWLFMVQPHEWLCLATWIG
jgi:hypothetical protein